MSRTVARALSLNEDLAEAIGLGHDLGHPPFGHIGEDVLDRCLKERFGAEFHHWEQSLRVVDALERDGRGLNLTEQVRDGILCHSGRAPMPATLEGAIVRLTDRFAYINHDIDDALRAGLLGARRAARRRRSRSSATRGPRRIDTLVHDLVTESEREGAIVQGESAAAALMEATQLHVRARLHGRGRAPRALKDRERDPKPLRALLQSPRGASALR